MEWWQASALVNGIIAACYLGIVWNIVKGLRDSRQLLSNSLALSTAGIFFTCAVHHGSHTLHMMLPYAGLGTPDGLAMRQAFGTHMTLWDLVGAVVAVYYLTLRRSYGRLLASPQLFEDRVREQSEQRLRHQAFTDALTGLPNRSAFGEHMAQLAAVDGAACTLLFIDLDRFKVVNDTLGHDVGDQLLRAVAARLQEALSAEERLFRLGGDEFTVVAGFTGADAAVALGERTLEALRTPLLIDGHTLHTSASVGVAFAEDAGQVGDLLRQADTAMYQAKNAGRGTVRLFASGMSDKGRRLALFNDLERALERGELELDLQPIVHVASGHIRGAEALVRWRHPQRGRIQPDDFIPFAEESGQIYAIGRWVLAAACREAAGWSPARGTRPFVTVNASAVEVERDDYVTAVRAALQSASLEPERLWVEITERGSGGDLDLLATRVLELEQLGVRVALDDFGTGWSSLSHLQQLPVKMIKVDRAFVAGLPGSTAHTLASTVLALGQALGLRTVAEGVETPGQLQQLQELGCELAQGFLLGRPVACNAFAALWESQPGIPAPRSVQPSPAERLAGLG